MKNCPFCGSKAELQHYTHSSDHAVYTLCTNQACGASSGFFKDEEKAIEAWERRE